MDPEGMIKQNKNPAFLNAWFLSYITKILR